MQQQVNARITDNYNARGESLETLVKFHNGDGQNIAVIRGAYLTRYTVAFQILFPLVVIFFLGWLSHHLVENDVVKGYFKNLRNAIDHPENESVRNENLNTNIYSIREVKVSTRNMYILILIVCSVTFVVYVLALDIAAVANRHTKVIEKIFFNPVPPGFMDANYGNVSELFQIEYSIPLIMLFYDFVILFSMVVGLLCIRCGLKKKWYHVGIGPVACIVVHSYHIVVGFLHSPYHASGILIFYAIVALVYFITMRAAYYNLFHLYVSSKHNKVIACTDVCKLLFIVFGILLFSPIVLFLICVLKYKKLASCLRGCCTSECCKYKRKKRDNPVKRNKCLLCGCCVCDQDEFCSEFKFPYPIVMTILSLLSVFIAAVMVFVVYLFILVPISLAIDNAPNRLFGINQTLLVFIGAAITYKLYRSKKTRTWFDRIVEANESYLKDEGIDNTEWNKKEKADKEVEMGQLIIKALHGQAMQAPGINGE